jgi:hypothetical protein
MQDQPASKVEPECPTPPLSHTQPFTLIPNSLDPPRSLAPGDLGRRGELPLFLMKKWRLQDTVLTEGPTGQRIALGSFLVEDRAEMKPWKSLLGHELEANSCLLPPHS